MWIELLFPCPPRGDKLQAAALRAEQGGKLKFQPALRTGGGIKIYSLPPRHVGGVVSHAGWDYNLQFNESPCRRGREPRWMGLQFPMPLAIYTVVSFGKCLLMYVLCSRMLIIVVFCHVTLVFFVASCTVHIFQ